MINWLIFPIISAFLWALMNHLDKYLITKYCKEREIGGLVIFSGLIALPVLIIIYILKPEIIFISNLTSISIVILSGMFYLLGIIPYLYALEEDETSTVAPQMLLVAVFTLILGYLFLGEALTGIEIIGAIAVISGSIFLSLDREDILGTKFKYKVFSLMLISTLFIALNAFLFKYIAIETDFISTIFWLHFGYLLFTIIIFTFVKKFRKEFFQLIQINPSGIITINVISEVITLIGNISFHYSTLLVPLAIAEVVTEGIQPFFVLIIGVILTKLFPHLVDEDSNIKNIFQKVTSIGFMILGIILINLVN